MYYYIILILSVSGAIVAFIALRKTPFGLSLKYRNLGGAFWVLDILIYVVGGVVVFNVVPPEDLQTFFVNDQVIKEASLAILWSLIVLQTTILFIYRSPLGKVAIKRPAAYSSLPVYSSRLKYILTIVILLLLANSALLIFMGIRHAFGMSILTGADLLSVRLTNRYSGIPTQIFSYHRFLWIFAGVLYGLLFNRLPLVRKLTYGIILLFAATLLGAKGPLLLLVIIIFISALLASEKKLKISKTFIKGSTTLLALLSILYWVSSLQFSQVTFNFTRYLLVRGIAGSVGATYEQFGLRIQDWVYLWNSVPFASFFIDYPIFSKDLMTNLYGARKGLEETGVANSYFIGEALAIGGIEFIFPAVLMVALSYFLFFALTTFCCERLLRLNQKQAFYFAQVFVPVYLAAFNGDASGYLFFKIHIMFFVYASTVFIMSFLLDRKSRLSKRESLTLNST